MKTRFWLFPKNKKKLFITLFRELVGNAHIAIEGNINQFDFSSILNKSYIETDIIKSETGNSGASLLILPLEKETAGVILNQLIHKNKFIDEIEAIQIEKNGKIEFLSGDNFHNGCISVGEYFSTDFLENLIATNIIRFYIDRKKKRLCPNINKGRIKS